MGDIGPQRQSYDVLPLRERAEPVRREPVRREPVRREPVIEAEPAPSRASTRPIVRASR